MLLRIVAADMCFLGRVRLEVLYVFFYEIFIDYF